ncbi:putative membrane protein YphA (DoxX/SURF4 family) [Rhodococcus sp. 27YEA15]|uniref:MauE/DoxX family redox-associated membrane protein n=1 Tax=Rhodococcus sp. 27YEA15 TaxID=3156259 RepID=UPI003C7B878F
MFVRIVSLLARLGLAAVWLISGVIKFVDPVQTKIAVRGYQLLPESLVGPVATALPLIEIVLGLLILVGLAVRACAGASVLVLAALVATIISAWARGLSIDCGCFGGGGAADVDGWDYLQEILRDLGFIALAVWLVVFPRSPVALGRGSRANFSVETQS